MRSLGRTLRKVGETASRGGNRPRRIVYSSMERSSSRIALDRLVRRLSGWNIPDRAGTYAATGFLCAWVAYGTIVGGHLPAIGSAAAAVAGNATAGAGFAIDRVLISGHDETSERDVVDALALSESSSLLTFDPFAARERLSELPWVKSATVQKLFPDTLRVDLVERDAFALWQIGGMVQIVDRNGDAIGPLSDQRFAGLPLVVGYGANREAAELIDMIAPHPRLAARLRAAVWIADRRWNLLLDNGVEVRLPEKEPAGAITELARLDAERELLSRDIVAVDLRLSDRLVVRLSEPAAVQHKANMESRGQARRKGADI